MNESRDWRRCLEELRPLQPWPAYYEFRSGEMKVVEKLCEIPTGGNMVELGCGNAFHSFLMGHRFERILATDLYARDLATHTIGLQRAVALIKTLGATNIALTAASAEALPIATKSQDFVFSSNVLEHVPDQSRAVREVFRVLKPGGKTLNIVPAAMERVYNLPVSFIVIPVSMLRGMRNTAGRGEDSGVGLVASAEQQSAGRESVWRKARQFMARHYPRFPFPNPHGEYRSSTEEFLAHRPSRWEELFTSNGFTIDTTFTTILAPHNLGMAVSSRVAYWLACLGWPLTELLGGKSPFKFIGTSYAIMATRPCEESA